MKTILTLVFCMLFAVNAYAVEKTLTWDAPQTNEDGTELTDLAGYKVYNHGVEIADVGDIRTYTADYTEDNYSFSVRAYDTKGNESVDSNSLPYDLQICPAPPTNLAIQ